MTDERDSEGNLLPDAERFDKDWENSPFFFHR